MKEQIWQSILSFAGEEEQEKERLTELLSEPTVNRGGRKVHHLRRVGRVSVRAVAMALLAAFFVTAGPMKMVAEAADLNGSYTLTADNTLSGDIGQIDPNAVLYLFGAVTINLNGHSLTVQKITYGNPPNEPQSLTINGTGAGETLNVIVDHAGAYMTDSAINVSELTINSANVYAQNQGTDYPTVRLGGELMLSNGASLHAKNNAAGNKPAISGAIFPDNSAYSIGPNGVSYIDGHFIIDDHDATEVILSAPGSARKAEVAQTAVQQQYIPPHVHEYVWETTKEPTEEEDGEECYICKGCGAVQYRIPLTGCGAFNINTMNRILNAKPGETLHISTTHWLSFHKMIGDALAKRPDVTLVVDFLSEGHKGDPMSFTIPAGAGGPALFNADGYAGFHYLAGLFATGQ